MSLLTWLVAFIGFALAVAGVMLSVARRNDPWMGEKLGYFVGAVALVALFASVALGALDALLARMHVVGAADRGLTAITGFGFGTSAPFINDTIERWATWYGLARTAYVASPNVVLWTHLIIDSLVLVPAYVTLLAMVRWRSSMLEPVWRGEEVQEGAPPWKDVGQLLRRVGIPIALAAADLVENLLTEVFIREPLQRSIDSTQGDSAVEVSGGAALALRAATIAKWALAIFLILNTIPALITGLQVGRKKFAHEHQEGRGALGAALFRLRAMIALVAGFCLIATLELQVPDMIRRWSWREATFAGLSAIAFGVVAWIWSGRILLAGRQNGRQPSRRDLVVAMILVSLVGLVGLRTGPVGLFVLAVALAALVVIDSLGPRDAPTIEGPPIIGATVLPKLLAIAPVVFLGVGALRALLPEAIFNHPHVAWPSLLVLVFAGVLPIAVALGLYRILGLRWVVELSVDEGPRATGIRIVAIALAAYVYWRVVSAVWSFSQAAGALAVIGMFFTILAAVGGALSLWIERVPPSRGLVGLGFRRTPVFALLVVWLVVSSAVDRPNYHDVRTDLVASASVPATTIEAVLSDWLSRNPPPPDEGTAMQVPMLFIAANGGGIKAATWTAFALDCVLDGGDAVLDADVRRECEQITPGSTSRVGSVLAMSGVSGGSVGLEQFITRQVQIRAAENQAAGDNEREEDIGWVRDVLTDDFVGPSVAWQLFVEAPRSVLQFLPGMDRAEVLERAWERAWVEHPHGLAAALWGRDVDIASPLANGFMQTWTRYHRELPLLLLNSTTVEDGCRTIVSPLATDGTDPRTPDEEAAGVGGRNCTSIARLDGELPSGQLYAATRDVRHFLCDGSDVRLSTAALMSARFPWVSPSGRLPFCAGGGSVHVVDGGYLDNSGGETIAELWETVQGWVESRNRASSTSCIVPYLILVDSGYGPTPAPKSDDVRELLVPPKGFFAAGSSRTIEGRNDAALAFRRPVDGVALADRVATLYLRSQPEGEAPLGWTIDDTTAGGLEAQLLSNKEALDEIETWFVNTHPCSG
jgi:hypothetical protein